ncbi:MAG: cation-translocating P-type ATPase [Chthoniobacterales bacterium]
MKIQNLAVEEALASLHSSSDGLTAEEAQRRLLEYGRNEVEQIRGESMLVRFSKGFTHFFAIILWIAAGLSFFAEWRDPGQGMATLGFAILGVIAINGVFSFWQEYRAEQAVAALKKLLPQRVKVLRAGKATEETASNLVPGDVVFLAEGDNVPADCRLIEAFGVRVNNATITGESLPHSRDANACAETDFMQSRNVLLAGTSLVSGDAKALVFATGMRTAFGQIAHLTQATREPMSPLQKEIARLSRLVALLSLGLGALFFFIGRGVGLSFWQNFLFAIGIIIANVPEGLLPTVTLALAMGSQRMARRKALIRHLPSVETLGSATVICTDKTGTLTENRMVVRQIFAGGSFRDPAANDLGRNHPRFVECAIYCENVKRSSRDTLLGDPMEIALVQMGCDAMRDGPAFARVDEIPFDSDRKRLSTLHRTPDGLVLYTKGAPEVVLERCRALELDGRTQPLTLELREKVVSAQEAMAEKGLRVLALAHRSVPKNYRRDQLEEDLVLSGLVGLEDPPRAEVPEAIAKCHDAGIKVIVVTGDHPQTATAIAREIGLVKSASPLVITGVQLKLLSDEQLQLALDSEEIIFARVAADQKMRIVSALKRKGHIVAVTGDGVNDAPALKKADIGVSMGISGSDVARAAADMILLDDNFASIVAAIEEGRAVFVNIRKFLTYVLTSNVPELVPYLGFVLFKIPLALTIIQILAVDLGTDMLPALALGAEKPEPDVMRRPPRRLHERLFDRGLMLRVYGVLGLMESVAAMSAFFFILHRGGWHYGQPLDARALLYLQATTACLSAIVVTQIVAVFHCRSERESAFCCGLFTNKLLLLGIAVEIVLILLIDYTPAGYALFGTAPIPLAAWLFMFPLALAMLVLEELRKWLVRRSAQQFPIVAKNVGGRL